MAKKDTENFDFETESEGKAKFDLAGFFKNLTKKQKGIILAAVAGILLVIAIIVTCVIIGVNGDNNSANGGTGDDGINDDGLVDDGITNIYVASSPIKNVYYIGDNADYTGLSIFAGNSYGGGSYVNYVDNPDAFTITGFDSTTANESLTITVMYAGVSANFTVKVIEKPDAPPILTGIHLDPMPKTEYKVGEKFSYKTGKIVCTYDDGSTKVVDLTLNELSGFEGVTKEVGEHVITVKYRENGVTMKTTYTITVTE